MSSVNDFMRDLRGAVNKGVADGRLKIFADGFDEAANICVGVLSKNINDLLNRIKSGSYLSDQEQLLLSKLTEIRSETEKSLQDSWTSPTADEVR